MKIEIEVISKEIITPSSPTPDHLSRYQLSFLDQITPPVYNSMVLFYPTEHLDFAKFIGNDEKSDHLKQSLSEALTLFYPLAGRIKDDFSVDCNDEGVPYLVAQVKNCQVSDVLENPVPSELNKLLPFQLDGRQELLLGVQFNVFECGGVAISVCISHMIGDASSFFNFLKSWGATARQEEDVVRPQFNSATLFPPKDISGYMPRTGIVKENVVTRRFVFKTSSIEALKAKFTTGSESLKDQRPPSRIEVLSVFMWHRFVAATSKVCLMIHAVNLRSRMDPPLPEHSFGNYYRIAITFPTPDDGTQDCYYSNLVSQVRESISKVDKEFVKLLQSEGNEYLDMIKEKAESFLKGEMVTLNFTSLCRFPLYDADFGWGKPVWVGSPSLTFNNLIVFMDTPSGDGIEALVHLDVQDMAKLQEDEELLLYVDQSNC